MYNQEKLAAMMCGRKETAMSAIFQSKQNNMLSWGCYHEDSKSEFVERIFAGVWPHGCLSGS